MITVVGSLNMDLVVTAPRMPRLGETLLGSGFFTAPGGKGANQAAAAARLGGQVRMIGRVGRDDFGRWVLDSLQNNGVDCGSVERWEGPTGVAVITVVGGNNFIIVDPGANGALCECDIESKAELIRGSDMLVCQLEVPLPTVIAAADCAKKAGVPVLLNPAPARELPPELLACTDILLPNEHECEIITGVRIRDKQSAEEAVRTLRRMGVPRAVITLGEEGCVYSDGDAVRRMSAFPTRVVDTTAAGDCFAGALAVALCEGKDLGAAVRFASAAASVAVSRSGAQPSLPTRAEAEAVLGGL